MYLVRIGHSSERKNKAATVEQLTVPALKSKDGESSRIMVSLKYISVSVSLHPSESISNMGTLRVDILHAANVPSADRKGKSDLFWEFVLDGRDVHKTQVLKKTLHPALKEMFETNVAYRTAANLRLKSSIGTSPARYYLSSSVNSKLKKLKKTHPGRFPCKTEIVGTPLVI